MKTAELIKKEYVRLYAEMTDSTLVEIHNAACDKVMEIAKSEKDQIMLFEAYQAKMS